MSSFAKSGDGELNLETLELLSQSLVRSGLCQGWGSYEWTHE